MIFTIAPIVAFPAIFLLLGAVFPPAAVLILLAGCLYLMPAYIVANNYFGYRTGEGAPPPPIPASSPSSWLIILATHAALIGVICVTFQGGAGLLEKIKKGKK